MGKKCVLTLLMSLSIVAVSAPPARADEGVKLSDLLPDLFSTVWSKNQGVFVDFFGVPADDPQFEAQFRSRTATVKTINELMGLQLSTVPLGASGAGFSWVFHPESGTFERAANSFGPAFTERALTIGKGRFGLGVNYQRSTFDKLEGQSLAGSQIRHYTGLPDAGVFFEDSLDLKLTTDTVAVAANYGLTDRLDLGVMVPISRVKLDATLNTRVGNVRTGVSPDAEVFSDRLSGTASGIGDIVARAKYNFLPRPGGGLAGGLDVRLPTGDELNLLGIAGYQMKLYLAGSSTYGKVSPHFNAGFTASGETKSAFEITEFVLEPPDEMNYAGGVDVAVTPRLTAVGDVIGRRLRGLGSLRMAPSDFGTSFKEFMPVPGDLNQLLGAAGVKFNPRSNALVSANVLFPLRSRGLTDTLTLVLGVDYSF